MRLVGWFVIVRIRSLKPKVALLIFALCLFQIGCGFGPNDSSVQKGNFEAVGGNPFSKEAEKVWVERLRISTRTNLKAEIQAIRAGLAEISSDDGKSWNTASVWVVFVEGSIIRTDARATLDVRLGEYGPMFRMAPGTFARMVRLNQESTGIERLVQIMIELEQGQLLGNLKMAAGSKFLVRTHRGVAEPLGEYEVTADGKIRADGGRVYSGGEVVTIEAGRELLF